MENTWSASPFTLETIKNFEGYAPKPAWDFAQHSVGWGTKWQPGTSFGTRADHEAALASEAGKVKGWLSQNVKVPLDENKEAALVSAGFNLGYGEKGIGRLLPDINAGNWDRVGQRLLSFNKAGGEVNQGLVNRRQAEAEMLTGRRPTLPEAMGSPYATAGAPPQPAPGAMPPEALVAPSGRYSKLADALMASAAGAKPKGWGDLLNASGDLALGYTLANKDEEKQKAYKGKLSQALLSAQTPDALTQTLIGSGDPDLIKAGIAAKIKPKTEIGRFRPTKQGVVDTTTGQIVPGTEQKGTDNAEYGTSPQYYKRKDGSIGIGQMSKAGGMRAADLPEDGAEWLPPTFTLDTGTERQIRTRAGAVPVESVKKDILGKESAEEIGKSQGLARQGLPAAKTTVDNALKTIGELRAHPGIDVGTGASTVFDPRSWIPGTEAYDFQAKNKQATGQSFMAAREGLKGAGQVTDFEGAKGQEAIANLDTAQSKEQYLAALDTLEHMMMASYKDLQTKAGQGAPAATPSPQSTPLEDPLGIR